MQIVLLSMEKGPMLRFFCCNVRIATMVFAILGILGKKVSNVPTIIIPLQSCPLLSVCWLYYAGSCLMRPIPRQDMDELLETGYRMELETKVHPKVRNHGEGPY